MTTTTRTLHRWDTRAYAEIRRAEFRSGVLTVEFADGSAVMVDPERLVPPGWRVTDWSQVTFDEHELVGPTTAGPLEIPRDVIGRETDAEFLAYWNRRCAEIARDVGRQFRDLREARGLKAAELARRVGVSVETIERLESGELSTDLDFDERVLAAMGCTLDDLIAEPLDGSR